MREFKRNREVLIIRAAAAGALSLLAAGCATLPEKGAGAESPTVKIPDPAPVAQPAPNSATRSEAYLALEKALAKDKGSRLLVSRKVVEELLRSEQATRQRCEKLSDQLEALKSIDAADPRGLTKP